MLPNDIIAIIPARGGSKGILGKNLRMVAGQPLIAHSILAALGTPEIGEVIVSTDSPEIARVAQMFGASVVERPASLSTDTASSESALLHVLDDRLRNGKVDPSAVVFLQATSPMRERDDVTSALRVFSDQHADSLFSATRAHAFMWRSDAGSTRPLNYNPAARPRRQDAPLDLLENGSFYIFKPSVLRDSSSRLGGKITYYLMPARNSFQLDEPWELELLDSLMAKQDAPRRSPHGDGESGPSIVAPNSTAYFTRREPRGRPDFEAAYWGEVTDPDGKRRDRATERAQHLEDIGTELNFVQALPPGRVLDVGCGLGFLLSGIPATWDKHGVEVSELAATRAKVFGTIHHGTLDSAHYADESFDVVVIHHVIEHVDDPVGLVVEALRVLKSGGKMIIGTPDFDSAMARRFGERYRLLHDPTHVSLFTNESLYRMLRDRGLVIDHVDYPFFETRHFSKEGLLRVFDTDQMSPAFYGSFMTFYCTKPPVA